VQNYEGTKGSARKGAGVPGGEGLRRVCGVVIPDQCIYDESISPRTQETAGNS
jgi:hypothetical protein